MGKLFSVRSQIVNILDFADHMVWVVTPQLSVPSLNAELEDMCCNMLVYGISDVQTYRYKYSQEHI